MASFESIASGVAHHPGACVGALAFRPGLETQAAQPSGRPARQCGDAS
jgi:hypothetical protein